MRFRLLAAIVIGFGIALAPAVRAAETLDEAATNVKVRAVLLEHFGTDALGIHIQVSGGNVVLSGNVEKPNTRELAKQAAQDVKGVTSVENRIELGNAPAAKANAGAGRAKMKLEDALLEAKVKGRLFDQVGGNAMKIEVTAIRGLVTLKGTVPTKNIRETAVDTARKTSGVVRLRDFLSVG